MARKVRNNPSSDSPTQAHAWIRRVIQRAEGSIVELHGRGFLPASWDTLGCGAFGCVMRTRTPGVVCKVTMDGAEAFFARAQGTLGQAPDGVCRFWEPIQVPTKLVTAWVIWRQAVDMPHYRQYVYETPGSGIDPSSWLDVEGAEAQERAYERIHRDMAAWDVAHGKDADEILDEMTNVGLSVAARFATFIEAEGGSARGFARVLAGNQAEAAAIFDPVKGTLDWSYAKKTPEDPGLNAALRLLAYRFQLDRLAQSPTMPELAAAVRYYLDRGLLLADMNADNIAKVGDVWTLFDCGFTVPIDPRWDSMWHEEQLEPLQWWRQDRWELYDRLAKVEYPGEYFPNPTPAPKRRAKRYPGWNDPA